jgi:hypothetical protein
MTKLTPSLTKIDGNCGVERVKPGRFNPVLTFYDISGAGLHLYGTLETPSKYEVWPNGGTRRDICR